MFGRLPIVFVFCAITPFVVMPTPGWAAEPAVEINAPMSSSATSTSDSSSDESSVLSLPHIPLNVSIFTHGGYDDNFRTSQAARGSWFTEGGGNLVYDLPTVTTHLTLTAGADVTYFIDQNNGQTDNVNAYISGLLIHNVSERLKLDANVYVAYRTEPDFGSNVGADTRIGDFFHSLDSLAATYHWTQRFATATSDRFQLVEYQSNSAFANSFNRFENTVGQEFRYDLLHSGNTMVLEYRFEIIDYDTAPRDSLTNFALLGFDEDFTSDLRLSVRGGATFRDYSNRPEETDPHFEASLSYAGAHHSLLTWRASYGIEEPSVASVLGRTTFRTGLDFKYGLTDRITASLSAYYHHDDNRGTIATSAPPGPGGMATSGFSEDAFDISGNLRYQMSNRFSIEGGVEYSEVTSQSAVRDYSRLRSFAGVRLTF